MTACEASPSRFKKVLRGAFWAATTERCFRVVADAVANSETDASSAKVCSRCNNRLEVRTRRLLRSEFGAAGVFERISGRARLAFS